MDQKISVKNIFNYCFNGAHFRTKSKEDGNSECNQYVSGLERNVSEPKLKTEIIKNLRLHKLASENNSSLRDFSDSDNEVTGIKPPSNTKQKKNKYFLSCFKKKSSEDNPMSTVKKSPIIIAKLTSDTTVQSENSVVKEAISYTKLSQSPEPETKSSKHYSHNSVVELMSRDGTLQLYSASTLTPLSSSAIQDEAKIQTHLSVSCFRPGNYAQYSSSEGSDEVFEASGETSKSLASNLQKLDIGHSKRASENNGTRMHRNEQCHVNYNNKSRYPVKDLISADGSLTLYSDGNEKKILTDPLKESKNKISPVLNYCSSLETENGFSSIHNFEKRSCNHFCPPNSEKKQIASSGSLASSSCQKQDHTAHSSNRCVSVTREIPPVKKWILQLYFNSLVAADENFYSRFGSLSDKNYPKENKTENSSSPKSCLRTESQNRCFERHRQEINRRNLKTNLTKSKMLDDYTEKENKLNQTRINNISTTTKSRARLPVRKKYRNSKAAHFSQDTIYTHYPFIDGPLAENSRKTFPINDLGPNCESCVRAVKYEDLLV